MRIRPHDLSFDVGLPYRPTERAHPYQPPEPDEEAAAPSDEAVLLAEIRDLLSVQRGV